MIEQILQTLTPPEAWTKGAYARTAKGRTIGPQCEPAVCFCIEGAILRTEPDLPYSAVRPILGAIRELFPDRNEGTIPSFNDHPETTHADVLLVLRRARDLELA